MTKYSFEVSRKSIQMAVNAVISIAPDNLVVVLLKPKVEKFLEESPELYFRVTIEGMKEKV